MIICAQKFSQARIIYEDVVEFMRGKGYDLDDRKVWRKMDSSNAAWLEHRESGARVRCIGSDSKNAHGLRPYLCLIDEPSAHEPSSRDALISALRTGLGKQPNSRLFALGTRPVGDHWFARLLADPGPSGYSQVHAAAAGDPVDDIATWRKANPSIDHLPSLRKQIATEAVEAMRDSSALASFQSSRLNMGTSDVDRQVLLDAATWTRCEVDDADLPPREGTLIFGIDAGTNLAMSAISAMWSSGRLEIMAGYPHVPDLVTRAKNDQVPPSLYMDMKARGEVVQCGNRIVELDELLTVAAKRYGNPDIVVGDRHRDSELLDRLNSAKIPAAEWVPRGMGFIDGAADVREFRRMCISDRVKTPRGNLLMTAAMAECVTISDSAGNQKICKGSEGNRRSRGRDDAACSTVLAVAEMSRRATDMAFPRCHISWRESVSPANTGRTVERGKVGGVASRRMALSVVQRLRE